jgi:hypothetical protein
MRRWLVFFMVCCGVISVNAQGDFRALAWVEGDLGLQIPSNWQTATTMPAPNQQQLTIAQAFADDDANRPLAIPFIKLTRISNVSETTPEVNIEAFVAQALADIGLENVQAIGTTFLEQFGVASEASNADNTLFGLGRGVLLPDNSVVLIVGRATRDQEGNFRTIFNALADSLVVGAGNTSLAPQYGVLWSTLTLSGQSTNILANIRGMAFANEQLWLVDALLGVIQMDAQTGAIVGITPFVQATQPTSLVLRSDGAILVGDTLCHCVQILQNGVWQNGVILAENAPQSLVMGANDTLYASDFFAVSDSEQLDIVSVLTPDISNQLTLDVSDGTSPLLAIDAGGRLLAISRATYNVSIADEFGFSLLTTLELPPTTVNALTVNGSNQLLVATQEAGVLIFDMLGKQIGSIGQAVPEAPQAGQFLHPQAITTARDGRVFVADGDGLFGRITAMSLSVTQGRVGATDLVNGLPVEGRLDATTPQQAWVFDGQDGDIITLNAINPMSSNGFDMALRLFAPDGDEIAYNDNQESGQLLSLVDAQLLNIELDDDGEYRVMVERVRGEGGYRLGLSQSQNIALNDAGETVLSGTLSEVVLTQLWTFEGAFNTNLVITVITENGTLDPYVRLLDGRGNPIAENDDALDASLGRNAQLTNIVLPNSGTYTLEVLRVGGDGQYRLIIEPVTP